MIVIHVLCLYMYVSVRVCACLYVQSVFFWVYLLFHLMHQTHCPQLYMRTADLFIYCCVCILRMFVHICMQCYLCKYMNHDCRIYYSVACTSVLIIMHL